MLADIALHWFLDMSGAVTFACILRGCRNAEHQHHWFVRWMANHPWIAQSIVAVIIAYWTVKLIG